MLLTPQPRSFAYFVLRMVPFRIRHQFRVLLTFAAMPSRNVPPAPKMSRHTYGRSSLLFATGCSNPCCAIYIRRPSNFTQHGRIYRKRPLILLTENSSARSKSLLRKDIGPLNLTSHNLIWAHIGRIPDSGTHGSPSVTWTQSLL